MSLSDIRRLFWLLALETELELKVLAFAVVDEAVDLLKQAGNTILSMILANILSDLPYNKDIFKPNRLLNYPKVYLLL